MTDQAVPMQNILQPIPFSWHPIKLWRWLTEPALTVTDFAKRANLRLLRSMAVVFSLVTLTIPMGIAPVMSHPENPFAAPVFWTGVGFLSTILITYIFARYENAVVAGFLLSLQIAIGPYSSIMAEKDLIYLPYMALATIVSLYLVVGRRFWFFPILSIALTISLIMFFPESGHLRIIMQAAFIAVLAIGLNLYRIYSGGIEAHQRSLLSESLTKLQDAYTSLEEANRLKSEFLAVMSHELRTPLHAIIGYADIQLAGMAGILSDEVRGYQDRILSNADHLLKLINDVLDISKIEAGRMELVTHAFDVKRWADDIVYQMQGLANEKNLKFSTIVSSDLPGRLNGDPERLKQIAINLLSNGIKFTQTGEVIFAVERKSADLWAIRVTDTGIGIPREAQEYIFDEFRQVDSSTNRKHGGTGLGLAIVRKLVQVMKGSIDLKSEVGKGSTFTINLPLQAADAVPQPAKNMGATA